MNFKNANLFFVLFIFLFLGGKSFADGRLAPPTLQWHAGEGSLNFHSVNIFTLVSDDEEYSITLDPNGDWIGKTRLIAMKISLGSKNGFSSFKQVNYAFVPVQFTVSKGETIYASMDSNNQIILSKGLTDYINGPYPLTHVKRESKLSIVNESNLNIDGDSNEAMLINNGSRITLTSNQNKYSILFEDMGWNTFKPEAQDLMPQRRIKVWLETESLTDPSEHFKRLYAVVEYSYLESAVNEDGSYFVDLPIEMRIDKNKQLLIMVNANVSYPFGPAFLD